MFPYGRDLGLHLLVARGSGGDTRAMFEPLLAGLRDAGCLTLLMSASPEEGLAVGSVRQSAAARPQYADHSSHRPAISPGRLDPTGVRSHVIEIGPNAVRRLCCGVGTVDDAEVELIAFEVSTTRSPWSTFGP